MDPKGKTVIRNLGVMLKQREQDMDNVKIAVGLLAHKSILEKFV